MENCPQPEGSGMDPDERLAKVIADSARVEPRAMQWVEKQLPYCDSVDICDAAYDYVDEYPGACCGVVMMGPVQVASFFYCLDGPRGLGPAGHYCGPERTTSQDREIFRLLLELTDLKQQLEG